MIYQNNVSLKTSVAFIIFTKMTTIKQFKYNKLFNLESGKQLNGLQIAYVAEGKPVSEGGKVVWICHALTANSDVFEWWSGLVGEGKLYDPKEYFIVCANILGSCYGTTGPTNINPQTGKQYLKDFPDITVRDMVKAQVLLREHLNINQIDFLIGGSLGGFQALEWAIIELDIIKNLILLATNARQSAFGIGIHAVQRMVIENDLAWKNNNFKKTGLGINIVRAIGMLHYRHYDAFQQTQLDDDERKDNYKIESYLKYQGEKLAKRFDLFSYYILSKAMDSHHIGRGRGALDKILKIIKANTLIIGISSDHLCPVAEQKFISDHISEAKYVEINSIYGHDGFLIEYNQIEKEINSYYDL